MKGSPGLPAETYFPNSGNASSATLVDVLPGAEIRGIEIRMRRGRVFDVSGNITNTLGGPLPENFQLSLVPKNQEGIWWFDLKQASVSGKLASFQFNGVEPGRYVLQTHGGIETKDPTGEFSKFTELVSHTEVTVTDQDLDKVIVPVGVGSELTGRFKTDGRAETVPQEQNPSAKKSVQLVVSEGFGLRGGYAEENRDDTFA